MPLPTLRLENIPTGSIRASEMAVLDAAWASLAKDPSAPTTTVFVEGPSGSGKSFLVETWHAKHAVVHQGHHQQQQQQPPPAADGIVAGPNSDDHTTIPLIHGKFHQVEGSSQPYRALADILMQLCMAVSDKARLQDVVKRRLGRDVQTLTYCAPKLKSVLYGIQDQPPRHKMHDDDDDDVPRSIDSDKHALRASAQGTDESLSSSSSSEFQPDSGSFDRFSYLFCEFLQCISSLIPRFILFVDGLQWADDQSLELIETIATDQDLYGFLILLTSRPVIMSSSSNGDGLPRYQSSRQVIQLDGTNKLENRFVTRLRTSLDRAGKNLQYVQVGDLSVDQVNAIVSAATELNPATTLPLSEIVHEKTAGNALFVVELLESLQRRQLLRYSMVEYKWTWDENEIRSQTDLADNVAAVVFKRIQLLPKDTQRILHLAALMGYSFEAEDLFYLVKGMYLLPKVTCLCESIDMVTTILPECAAGILATLQKAVDVGVVDAQGDSTFKFAHDSIHQSFLSRASEESASPAFYLRVGSLLNGLFRQPNTCKCFALFGAVEALNRGKVALKKECCLLTLAKMNLEAAESAYLRSSFFRALDYVNNGIEIVEATRKPWANQYKLMSTLYRRAAVMALTCGNHDLCQSAAKTVLQHGRSFQDKSSSYLALASSLRGQSKFADAESTLLEALETLGEIFPKRFVRIKLSFSNCEISRALGKLSDEDLVNLPKVSHRRDRKIMKFLNMLYVNAYLERNQTSLTLATQHMMTATLKFGLCRYSPLAFAACALQVAGDGNFDDATRYGVISHRIIEKVRSKENLALVYFFLVAFVEHLKKPMSQSIPTLEKGWQVGMEAGDVESAFLCATTLVTIRLLTAYPLSEVAKLAEKYFRMARTYGQTNIAQEFLMNWHYAANLAGQTEDPLVFDGVVMQEEAMMGVISSADCQNYVMYVFLNGFISLFMGDCVAAVRFFDEGTGIVGFLIETTHYNINLMYIPICIAYYKLYARTKESRLLAKGRRMEAALRAFVTKGAINAAAGLMFVEAQKAAIDQKLDVVKQKFDRASKSLHLCGFQHWEALACENFAEYALAHGDEDYASQYMKRAYELYLSLGALAKTTKLQASHAHLLKGLDSAVLDRANNFRTSKLTYESQLESSHRSSWQN